MALTNAQKVSVRYWLGYSGRFYQTDSQLEQAMAAINDADLEARIAEVIAQLEAVDAKRADVRSRAGILQVDEIVFQDGKAAGLDALRSEGSMLVGRLAALFGVPVRRNPFSTSVPGSSGAYMRHG